MRVNEVTRRTEAVGCGGLGVMHTLVCLEEAFIGVDGSIRPHSPH